MLIAYIHLRSFDLIKWLYGRQRIKRLRSSILEYYFVEPTLNDIGK